MKFTKELNFEYDENGEGILQVFGESSEALAEAIMAFIGEMALSDTKTWSDGFMQSLEKGIFSDGLIMVMALMFARDTLTGATNEIFQKFGE